MAHTEVPRVTQVATLLACSRSAWGGQKPLEGWTACSDSDLRCPLGSGVPAWTALNTTGPQPPTREHCVVRRRPCDHQGLIVCVPKPGHQGTQGGAPEAGERLGRQGLSVPELEPTPASPRGQRGALRGGRGRLCGARAQSSSPAGLCAPRRSPSRRPPAGEMPQPYTLSLTQRGATAPRYLSSKGFLFPRWRKISSEESAGYVGGKPAVRRNSFHSLTSCTLPNPQPEACTSVSYGVAGRKCVPGQERRRTSVRIKGICHAEC